MREIKFRAWDKEECEMLSDVSILDDTWDMLNEFLKHKDELAFMQYTGLKDKNGVEIYEGDIATMIVFEDNDEYLGYVVFENGCFCLNISLDGTKYKVPASEWKETETIITVIGNIYENPELLEREAE